MSGLKGAECRKFQANIFNKSKCTNCFKQREEHSPEALESNRASRKVSKCGYLFVAPDWDFTIPLNRTKRWQRRWFVLYDDGELTYSLDDHPATIPQGVVDMNRVLEVSCAEEVTGNQFSLAITAPDRVTFIKATCKEEAKWWMDVLSVFPCTLKQQGRHKRNATFPGIKTTTAKQTRHTAATMAPTAFETAAGQRVRFHSCTTDPMIESRPQSAPAPTLEAEEDVFPTKDSSPPASSTLQPSTHSSTNTSRCFSTPISTSTPLSSLPPSSTPFSSLPPSSARLLREEQKENTPYIGDYTDNPPTSESPPTQDKMSHKLRARRAPRRTEGRGVGLTQPRTGEVSRRQLISDLEETKREEKLKDIADSLTRPRGSALSYVSSKPGAGDVKPTRESDAAEELDPPPNSANSQSPDTTSPSHPDHVRGDPDGCGLELSPPYPASPDLQRVDLPAEDLLYIKKGWLMKQSLSQEWIKYWFVLRGTALMFYRDPGAEDSGILAGIIDLSLAKSVEESEVARNYGFTIATWEEKKYIFSAVTSGIRANWVQALRNAANLKEQKDRPLTLGEKIEREIVAKKEKTNSQGRSTFESMAAERERDTKFHTESRASSNNSHFAFSSDEEGDEEDDDEDDDDDDEEEDYRTASETSIRLQQASEDICDWGNSRSDSTKQSRSSPLTSRRSAKEDYLTSKLAATSTTTTTTTTTTTATNSSSSSGSGGRDVCCSETGSLHSISDLDDRLQPEKDGPAGTSTTTLPASGDALLVDLLETQVESLKAKLEQTQVKELLDRVEEQEHDLSEKAAATNQLNELRKKSLQEAEKKIQGLASELEEERTAASTPKKLSSTTSDTDVRQQNQQLSIQLEHLTTELSRMRDTLKSEKSEVYKWKDLVKELRSLLDGKNDEIERKREELDEMRENLKTTQRELEHTTDRLHRGIEENENLCTKVRELERTLRQDKERRASSNLSISSSRERFTSKKALPRIDSLSDLTNVDLSSDPEEMSKEQLVEHCGEVRVRLERAIGEIRALKRQVREGQEQQDQLELSNLQLRQDMKGSKGDFNSQLNLMTCRIQDLTNKLTNSEKQVRVLRQKMSRAESRDRRRTQSLKGRESFTLSRDMEAKLGQLEAKLEQLLRPQDQCALPEVDEEKGKTEEKVGGEAGKMARRSRSFEESTKSSRLRRKSLDSPGSSDAMKAIVRLNALEAKVSELTSDAPVPASGGDNGIPSLSETAPAGTSKPSSTRARSPPHSATSPLRSVPHARSPIRSPSVSRKTLRSPRATPEKTTKVSRSDSEIRHLRERLGALDKVITTLQTQLGECVSWAGAVECVCSCGAPGLSSLQQRLGAALHLAQLRHSSVDQSQVARVKPLALKLQDMLRDKLAEFAGRRDHLKNEGKWTRDVQVKMFAERLAYETLVLSQLAQVMQASQRPSMYEASAKLQELVEAHRKLSFLEKKLTNPDFDMDTLSPLDFYTSLLAEKLVVQGEVVNPSSRRASSSPPPVLGETCRDLQARLLERERNLAGLLTRYKEEKLHQIAVVMARETITGTGPGQDDTVLVEEVRMRQVWTLAQELVSQELANTEAGQSLLRLSHLLSPDGPPPTGAVPWPTAASLEHCHRAAEESLRQEMEEAVFTLSNKYEAVLARHRAGDTDVLQSVSTTMDALLAEFAAVTAQKAVIDGQLAVVQGEGGEAAPEALAIVEEVKDTVGSASDVVASEAHLLMFLGGRDSSLESLVQPALDQAEFTFMYNKATMQGAAEVAKLLQEVANAQASLDVKDTSSLSTSSIASTSTTTTTTTTSSSTTLTASKDGSGESSAVLSMGAGSSAAKTPSSPKARRKSEGRRSSRRSSDITGMAEGCRQCEELRQEVAKLKRSMDLRRAREREVECKQCLTHLANIKALEEEHQAAVAALKAQHQQELARVGMLGESSGGPVSTTDGELTELQRRLSLLEEGYEAQITALKHQYEEALGSQPDLCEEKVRQRYQLEIEHLRGLCEKGLGAMENSHKRMLMEMEEKHCRELAALQAEKEQALAEETQATLAALDAMRKAHESEVQREIAKFKEEFIRKMQSSHDLTAIHKEHEAEMEDIRREILSLSQKYSVKCLESASLEEKLDALTRQLADVNKQLFDLQARNKQLKTHLSAQVSQLQAEGKRDAESQLKLCEAELGLMKEEVARLTQQLHQTQTHESDLGELCRQLGQFLKAERQLRTDEVASLRDKLEAILVTAAAMQEQWRTGESGGPEEGGKQSPTRGAPTPPLNRSSKELIRSPSCPRLSGVSSFLSGGPWQGRTGPPTPPAPTPDLPSPLAGMVATRKKVFETRHALMEPL
ncbi:protein outspread-like isoform X18 [Scylla paramamosain]|uniref:protein outspread-like isoform X18 n=1 Tax=Scylla paramamosain TaxID=85552 RepID=UPI0030832B1D